MIRIRTLFAAAGAFALAIGTLSANAQTDGPASMIVMDVSGSMWGQIDGVTKIEIARETLASVLGTLPDDVPLGLIAYGHREKGNCADIELLAEPATGNATMISDTVNRLTPTGKTPLTDAVRMAADVLKIEENAATVVLVTDGIETCDADPCALGAELERLGVNFTTHVIGFGLSREEGRQVACLAEATGGRYIEAGDAAELTDALTETVASAPVADEPEPDVETPDASVSAPETAAIGASVPVTWTGPDGEDDYIDIVPRDDDRTFGEASYVYTEAGNPASLRMPGQPGAYDIRYVWVGPDGRRVAARTSIDVTDSEVALVADATASIGSTLTVDWRGPDQDGDYIDIVPEGFTATAGELSYAYTRDGSPATLRVPGTEGAYQVRYILQATDGRRVMLSVPLNVVPADATLAFPPTAEIGGSIDVYWTGPDSGRDYIDIVPEDYTATAGELSYAYTEDGDPATLRVPGAPGVYDVRYILEAPDGRQPLVIAKLDIADVPTTLSAPDSVETGTTFAVEWTGPNRDGDYVDLVPQGQTATAGELAYFYTEVGAPGSLTAPNEPGAYEIRYVMEAIDGRFVLATVPITVQ